MAFKHLVRTNKKCFKDIKITICIKLIKYKEIEYIELKTMWTVV